MEHKNPANSILLGCPLSTRLVLPYAAPWYFDLEQTTLGTKYDDGGNLKKDNGKKFYIRSNVLIFAELGCYQHHKYTKQHPCLEDKVSILPILEARDAPELR